MEPQQQSATLGSNPADLSTTNERGSQDADASVHAQGFRRPRVLLAVSGSVAAIKAPQLLLELGRFAEVQVVASAAALHFLGTVTLPPDIRVHQDEDDWRSWQAVGDAVLHIDLRRWADAMVVAPLSANTLSKMAAGACGNLLTCVVRAWDFSKPLLVAPAMNTLMWNSPFTSKHLEVLTELGVAVVPPVIKVLACGDHGDGAMASPAAIAQRCREALSQQGFDLPEQ